MPGEQVEGKWQDISLGHRFIVCKVNSLYLSPHLSLRATSQGVRARRIRAHFQMRGLRPRKERDLCKVSQPDSLTLTE